MRMASSILCPALTSREPAAPPCPLRRDVDVSPSRSINFRSRHTPASDIFLNLMRSTSTPYTQNGSGQENRLPKFIVLM